MKNVLMFLVITAILSSCNSDEKKNFPYAGGCVRMAVDNELSTFIAREVYDYYSATVLSQVMEGLVSLDPKDLKIKPQIASSWSISDDGLVYEFKIRQNILFHPHEIFKSAKERTLTTKDIIKSFEMACSRNEKGEAPHSFTFLFKDLVQGANEFYEGKSKSISGIESSGEKLVIRLVKNDENFLYKLSNVCAAVSSEKVIKAKSEHDVIGTGPFLFSEYRDGDPSSILLKKNNEYYMTDKEGNSLPYLDSLEFIFESRKLEQLEMFENHITDLISGLPTSRITKMLDGRIDDFNAKPPVLVMYDNPLLSTQYYIFNMTDSRFRDPKVRQAFNYAVDREKIGRDILRNQYNDLGYYGIVPPISSIFKGYDFESVKEVSYSYNPQKARQLLAEAGYPGGKGFGAVNLRFNIDETHSAVADEFAQQIFKVLNINVNIDGSTFEQKEKDASMANGELFRSAWTGDYPNPETFLHNFYGKQVPANLNEESSINQSRYNNPLFDHLYNMAKTSGKKTDAMEYYAKAERVLMQDPPIIPLWYAGDIKIAYFNVRNLRFNALNQFIFKEVYKKDWTEEEYKNATN